MYSIVFPGTQFAKYFFFNLLNIISLNIGIFVIFFKVTGLARYFFAGGGGEGGCSPFSLVECL